MKIIKNFTLINLLILGCIPTEIRPIPSMPAFVFSATSIITGAAVSFTALVYIPYLIISRHDAAQNFVKHQNSISSYTITVELRNTGKVSSIKSFTESDYKKVITTTLVYLKTELAFSKELAKNEKLFITPRITLSDEKTTQELLKISIPHSRNSARTVNYKEIEKSLIDRLRIPRIKTYASPIRYVVAGGALLLLSELLGFFSLIPAAIISIPLFLKHPSSAHKFVDRQEDIASYSVTVKIKRHVKTIKEHTFVGSDYQTVMDDALLYAHAEQTAGLRTVFKPSITLVDDEQIYPLRNIVKKILPKNSSHLARYWRGLARSLSDRFIIPNNDSGNITNLNRIAYFGLESGAWMLSPYVAVLPFLL